MTVSYSVRRLDVVRAYFRQLRFSSVFRRRVVLYSGVAVLLFIAVWSLRYGFQIATVIWAAVIGLLFVALLPFFMAVFVKSVRRILTITSEGIETTIGTKTALIPWRKVEDVVEDGTQIYIIGQSGNSFVVPSVAFGSSTDRESFISSIHAFRARLVGQSAA